MAVLVEGAIIKKIRNQHHSISSSHSSVHMLNPKHSKSSNNNVSAESRKSQDRKSKNKGTFALGTLRGLGCKRMAMPVSAIVKSAAEEGNGTRRKKKTNQRRKSPSRAGRPPNLAYAPDICCAPPGISHLSDVVPRANMNAQRTSHIPHSRVVRRSVNSYDVSAPGSPASFGTGVSRSHASRARQCHHLYFRSLDDEHQHRNWRLNVDTMSYEELLDLGDKIGQVNKGLSEEEITRCLKTSRSLAPEYSPLFIPADRDWRCSICQDGSRHDEEVGRLGCGHGHHINCIKQWLRQKNECPICKIPPIAPKATLSLD